MEKNLFREKSVERISSPEELHDYMRVTNPRLWMLLAAFVILLAGFLVYASTATMENTMTIPLEVKTYTFPNPENEEEEVVSTMYYATLPISSMDTIKPGMPVRLGSENGTVELIAVENDEDTGGSIQVLFEMEHENTGLRDGVYTAELVLESTTPLGFLWD